MANATVAAGLIPITDGSRRNPHTSTVACSNNPCFNETLTVDIGMRTHRSRLFVAVWSKYPDRKSMELIGAMSFSLKHCLTEPFSGWYYLLEEQLGMSRSLRCDSPPEPPQRRREKAEEQLYQNTTETHYKQPRRFPLSSLHTDNANHKAAYSTKDKEYSRSKVRRISSTRTPAPQNRPPPVPEEMPTVAGCSQPHTGLYIDQRGGAFRSSEEAIYDTTRNYGNQGIRGNHGIGDRRQESSAHIYKVPSHSLYKRPAQRNGNPVPVARVEENFYMNMQELARFDKPIDTGGFCDSSSSSSQMSSLVSSAEEMKSAQGSCRSGSSRRSSLSSRHTHKASAFYKKTSSGLVKQAKHRSLRRVKKHLESNLIMSPDSSQSSSDSQAAWARLNSGGRRYTSIVLKILRGPSGFGFSLAEETPVGVYQVEEGSTADRAGLKEGDKIVQVEKEDVTNANSTQLAAIIRHQQKSMELVVWRETGTTRFQRSESVRSNWASSTQHGTPVKRSGSRLSALGSARKKHKQQSKEKKGKVKRDPVADGVSRIEPLDRTRSDKALEMVKYLYEIEAEFCDVMRKSHCYYVTEVQISGKLNEHDAYALFQDIDGLISTSSYFASKLKIVVRQADRKMIATAPEIYEPKIEGLKQSYIKYVDEIEKCEGIQKILKPLVSQGSPKEDLLPLKEFIYNPLHHIQKVSAAFTVLLQNIENSNSNLPHVQKICTELQECCEHIEQGTRVMWPQVQSPVKVKDVPIDPEVAEIEQRLEFPSQVNFTLLEPNRHKIYWSEVKVSGLKHKMVAYLFSDLIMVARQLGGREGKLMAVMNPIQLDDIIDIDYDGSNDCEFKVHYMAKTSQKLRELILTTTDMETRLVWKGLLKDRLRLVRADVPTELSLSDQGIQVSESSECADAEEQSCDLLESAPLKLRSCFTDSMTAMADDLCSSHQLRNVSSNSGETTSDCLLLADYTKQEARHAVTVPVSVNNKTNTSNNNNTISQSVSSIHNSHTFYSNSKISKSAEELRFDNEHLACDEESNRDYPSSRLPIVDLSAITEEENELTSTSMHLSCSRDETPSDFVSTPKDRSTVSSRSALTNQQSPSACELSSVEYGDVAESSSKEMSRLSNVESLNHKSFSNPELCTDELANQSLNGYGEEMCTPATSSQQTSMSTFSNTETSNSVTNSGSKPGLTRQISYSDENIPNISYDSQRCELPCQPAKASFTFGDSPPSSIPTTPSLPTSPSTPLFPVFKSTSKKPHSSLKHVESDAKISSKSPAQRKSLAAIMRRSKSYTAAGTTVATPQHARFLQQQMNKLTVDQSSSKADVRQRKFSAVARNIRNLITFSRKKSEPTLPVPPLDVIQSWSVNIGTLLNDKYGLMLFKNFLCSEYSEENIDFWIACEEYKQLKPKQYAGRAAKIYADFVAFRAPREINLDSKTRMDTMQSIETPDVNTFVAAQAKIQYLMEKDSYRRFLKSSFYTNLVAQKSVAARSSD